MPPEPSFPSHRFLENTRLLLSRLPSLVLRDWGLSRPAEDYLGKCTHTVRDGVFGVPGEPGQAGAVQDRSGGGPEAGGSELDDLFPSCVTPAVQPPSPAHLQAILRLCASHENITAFLSDVSQPGALHVVETGDVSLDSAVAELLGACELFNPARPLVLRVAAALRDPLRESGSTLWPEFQHSLSAALETSRPIILVAPRLVALPASLRRLEPRPFRLAPLSAPILNAHVQLLPCDTPNPEDTPEDPHAALPGDPELAQLRLPDLALALRAGRRSDILAAVAHRLRRAGDTDHGLTGFPLAPEVRHPLNQMIAELKDWQAGRLPWQDVTRGLLLHGAPGTGKTEIPRLLAREAGINLVAGSIARWQSAGSRATDLIRAMRDDFARAAAHAPCIMFIDELDAFGDRTRPPDHNAAWTDFVVAGLLECLDGFAELDGVVHMSATNHLDKIDAAIRRPGRFDQVLTLRLPTPELLTSVFRWHLRGDLAHVDLEVVTRRAIGLSGAEIASLVRMARANARQARRPLTLGDLQEAVSRRRPPLSKDQQYRIALHRAGHAVAARVLCGRETAWLTVEPDAGEDGSISTERMLEPADIDNELVVLLAGRAAERLLLGTIGPGAGGDADSDIARATRLAAAAEVSLGCGEAGPLWRAPVDAAVQEMRHDMHLRRAVAARLEAAETTARDVLYDNLHVLEAIANTLAAAGALDRAHIATLLSRVDPRAAAQGPLTLH